MQLNTSEKTSASVALLAFFELARKWFRFTDSILVPFLYLGREIALEKSAFYLQAPAGI